MDRESVCSGLGLVSTECVNVRSTWMGLGSAAKFLLHTFFGPENGCKRLVHIARLFIVESESLHTFFATLGSHEERIVEKLHEKCANLRFLAAFCSHKNRCQDHVRYALHGVSIV